MKKLILVVMFVLCLPGFARAALLVYDLRVNMNQTGGATYIDDHHAMIADVGDVVQMTMYAVLPGITNTANSGVNTICYSLLSSNNGDTQRGNLANDLYSIFTAISYDGPVVDIDGDSIPGASDLDIGSTAVSDAGYDNYEWVIGINANRLTVDITGTLAIADVTWTATGIAPEYPDDTIITPYPHNTNGIVVAHQFLRDGTFYAFGYLDIPEFSPDALMPNVGVRTVTITCIPEPSTWILLGTGTLGLLAMRRRK